MNYNFDSDDKKPLLKRIGKELLIWTTEIIIVIGLAYFVANFVLEKSTMIGDSMENTLQEGDKILVNKFAYKFSDPHRFDVIVFKQNGKEHSYYNIKRIVGLPGETVQIKDGLVYIDGKALTEKVITDPIVNGGLADDEITLDENEYFVLGDNRNNSEDSRFANIGNIVKDDIVGKAFIRLNKFAIVNELNINREQDTLDDTEQSSEK